MKNSRGLIKKVILYRNTYTYNEHHDITYFDKKGVIYIEYSNHEVHWLDLTSMIDISDSDYLQVLIDNKKTKAKVLFDNYFFKLDNITDEKDLI